MPGNRFFKNIQKKNGTRLLSHPIDVRGDFFRALAVAIMDNLKSGIVLPEASLKKIFEYFTLYFPDVKKNHSHLSLAPETVDSLAFVLRQLALDEALANPERYQMLFASVSPNIAKEFLRQDLRPLHPCALTALAHVLNITVTLSIKDAQKALRAREVLNQSDCSSHYIVTLQVQGSVYLPCVNNQSYFLAVSQLPLHKHKPTLPVSNDILAATFEAIAQSNDRLWQRYESYRKMLNSAIDSDELTLKSLVGLYVRFLPKKEDNDLFSTLELQHNKSMVNGPREDLSQQKTKMLINALAGGLSTRHINERLFFDAIEQLSMGKPSLL